MAQRGYPGIHAGMPTAQCLRSASVVDGALRSKAKAKAKSRQTHHHNQPHKKGPPEGSP
ncbi:hypothetical protein [Pseudomonas citri]|uniref:hypothetical protein n=1 Tax=Pseudomonas citri TaxID=2978349 RepID=UPI0021B662EB|nr:hypothetical protein [Pseudomonas citri]